MSAILSVDALSHAYGKTPVVRELSFALEHGDIACLLGASGCGKTTVLRLICEYNSFFLL